MFDMLFSVSGFVAVVVAVFFYMGSAQLWYSNVLFGGVGVCGKAAKLSKAEFKTTYLASAFVGLLVCLMVASFHAHFGHNLSDVMWSLCLVWCFLAFEGFQCVIWEKGSASTFLVKKLGVLFKFLVTAIAFHFAYNFFVMGNMTMV